MKSARQLSRPLESVLVSGLFAACLAAAVGTLAGGCGLQEHRRSEPPTVGPPPTSTPTPGATGGTAPTTSGEGGTGGVTPTTGAGGSPAPVDAAPLPPGVDAAPPSAPPPSSPPGVGITINGTFVPKDKAIVFIHFGHSNMAGLAQVPNNMRPYFFTTGPNLWSYQGGGKFVPAVEPTAPDPPVHLGAGPGMAWLRAAQAAAGPDYHFISVAKGHGGSPSTDFVKGGLYYSAFMDKAIELKGKVTFGGVFIMLGITERHIPLAQQDGLPGRIKQIVADIRADLGEPNLPVLHTDYEVEATGDLALTSDVGKKIAPLIRMLPSMIPNLALIPTDGTPLIDNHHFNMVGHKLWADRGIQIMIDRGWFPWKK